MRERSLVYRAERALEHGCRRAQYRISSSNLAHSLLGAKEPTNVGPFCWKEPQKIGLFCRKERQRQHYLKSRIQVTATAPQCNTQHHTARIKVSIKQRASFITSATNPYFSQETYRIHCLASKSNVTCHVMLFFEFFLSVLSCVGKARRRHLANRISSEDASS